MPDRFAIPRWSHMRRMRHVQIDMADLRVELIDDTAPFGRLDETNTLAEVINIHAGYAGRPAPLASDERNFSGEHLFIGLSHLLVNPGLQNRIGEVRDAVGRLALTIRNIGVSLVGHDRAGPTRRRQEVVMGWTVQVPTGVGVRAKVRNSGCFLSRPLGGERGPQSPEGAQGCGGNAHDWEFGHRAPPLILTNASFLLMRKRHGQVNPKPRQIDTSDRFGSWTEMTNSNHFPMLARHAKLRGGRHE